MQEGKNIDYRFKLLYAIGMIMIVCGHIPGGVISILSDWFPYGGAHLALFIFASGYFYKSSNEDTVFKYIFKKIRTLIIPLYLYTVAYALLVQASHLKGFQMGGDFTFENIVIAPLNHGHQFIYNMGGWFIAPLFMVEVFNVLMRKVLKWIRKDFSEWGFFVISIALGITGNQLACWGYINDWWLALVRMLYFIPFYALGILYRNKLEKVDCRIPSFWYFAVVFALKLALVYHLGKMPSYTPSWCHDFTEGPLVPILTGYLFIALWFRIVTILEPVVGRSRWVNAIADNTYSIMMNQFVGFMIMKTVFALMSKCYAGFADFNWQSYKTDIFWYYVPKGLSYTTMVYVVAGLAFPILFQLLLNKLVGLVKPKKKKTENG
ncbi:MAG: acyltransferase [Lachnospiraceae bacterium]|nr:acyltransferase [Lachnospiraceae bacterium]